MNYYVKRGDQQYGPYSLADMQRYVAQGNIHPNDFARSEAMNDWVPVHQIVGNINVDQPAPPPVSYGQVPMYAQAGAAGLQPGTEGTWPVPVGLPWILVLILGILTCGLFTWIWMFVQAVFVRKLRTTSNPLLFYAIGVGGFFAANFVGAVMPDEMKALAGFIILACSVSIIAGHFSLRNALEEHYNSAEPIGLKLSGVMTFFFNTIYFQYHLSEIRNWKLTGILSTGTPSYRDAQPRSGITYTQSELDAMRDRPPQQ